MNRAKLTTLLAMAFLQATLANAITITATVASIDTDRSTFTLADVSSDQSTAQPMPTVVSVSPGDLAIGYVSDRITGDWVKSDGKDVLQTILPVRESDIERMAEVNSALQADTKKRKNHQYRKEGDHGINFAMHNQLGELVEFDDFKGKWIIMNFFFTRCMMPKMCPAQTRRMSILQRMAKDQGITNLQQLSVTFDPEYDTPGILNTYAKGNQVSFDTYYFLNGPKPVMLDLLKQYAVIAMESKNIIDHSVVTLLFNKDSEIVFRKNGTEWQAQEFLDIILKAESEN
jgi:protein SCO1/2